MYSFPFNKFPYYKNFYGRPHYSNIDNSTSFKEKEIEKNSTTNNNDSSTINNNSRSCHNSDSPFINILGINLYSDDILILCILLSLYLEGVRDEMLFISLILLLLT